MDLPNDIFNIIIDYRTQLYKNDVLCQLKQRFLHDRLMKEIFYNRYDIYYRFVERDPIPIVEPNFKTRGEGDVEYFGYGDDRYMEDYWERFRIIGCNDPGYCDEYFRDYLNR